LVESYRAAESVTGQLTGRGQLVHLARTDAQGGGGFSGGQDHAASPVERSPEREDK
jgi:hypothetical protein